MRKKRGIFKRIGAGFLAVAVCMASSNAVPAYAAEYESEYQYELETQESENAPSGEEQDGASQTVERQEEEPDSQKEEAAESQAEETSKASESASAEASESQKQSAESETETEETAGTEKVTKTEETVETEKVTETEKATETEKVTEKVTETETVTETEKTTETVTETESATETVTETEEATETTTETETEMTETEEIELEAMGANSDGVLAYYTFDEITTENSKSVIKDMSGASGRDAEVLGSGAEIQNKALYLPGGDKNSGAAYVQLPTGMLDGQENFSFTLWMKPGELNEDSRAGVAFGPTDKIGGWCPPCYLLLNPSAAGGWLKEVIVNEKSTTADTWTKEVGVKGDIENNIQPDMQWKMYAIVVSEDKIAGYYDGKLIAESDKTVKIADFGSNLVGYIGKSFYKDDSYYKCAVDEMKIFNKALTAEEVKAIYDEGNPQPEKQDTNGGLLARYDFSGLDGTIEADREIENHSNDTAHKAGAQYKAYIRGTGATASAGALALPGGAKDSGAYMELPTGLLDGKENLTISAWLQNTTEPGNYAGLYYGTKANTGFPKQYVLLNPCTGSSKFKGVMTKVVSDADGCDKETAVSNVTTDSNWGLYTIVVKGTTIYGYYNGRLVSEDTTTAKFSDFGSGLVGYVGCSPYPDKLYSGQVDKVEIYDKALTAEEVWASYEEGRQKEEEDTNGGLLARYDFNDLDGMLSEGTEIPNTSDDTNHVQADAKAVIKGSGAYAIRGALSLPGGSKDKDAYVELPTGLLDGKSNITLSAWMQNTTSPGNYAGLYYGSTEETPTKYILLNPRTGSSKFKGVMTKNADDSAGHTKETKVSDTTTDAKWGLYTIVVNGNTIYGYYNGQKVSEDTTTARFSEFGTDLKGYIGYSPYPDKLYCGQVDNIEIYDKALTSEEVASLYDQHKADYDITNEPAAPTMDKTATSVKLTDAEGKELTVTDGKVTEIIGTAVGKNPEVKAEITYSDSTKENGVVSWETDFTTKEKGEYADEKGTIDYYPYPLIEERPDPFICYDQDAKKYYFTSSWPAYGDKEHGYDRISIRVADTVEGLASAEDIEIWHAHAESPQKYHIWAPELHKIGNDWYVYYAASTADNGWGIRCFVLKCEGGKDITDKNNWNELGQFKDKNGTAFDKMTLDMTYFTVGGKHYVIWAEKPDKVSYLKMGEIDTSKPAQLSSDPIILTIPEYDWEMVNEKVNEGPAVFIKDNTVYVTYSASATGDEYCVGMLTASTSSDLMDTNSWTKSMKPVLSSADISGQYGPGHNSFFEDENGDLMIAYHARDERCHSDNCDYSSKDPLYDPCRNAIVQKVRWTDDGKPVFTGSAVRDIPAELRKITATINVGNISAQEKAQADLDAIEIHNQNNIKGCITLPTEGAKYKSTITWTSDNESVIATDGIVTRPGADTTVTLTATATYGTGENAVSDTKTFTLTVKKAPEPKDYAGYLFAYFTGEGSANGEQIYFATSQDGLKWTQWNDGAPALTSTLGEKGLRDPFIIRSPEGDKFYLIATDLKIYGNGNWTAAQENGSKSIMIWESDDLVNWSEQRMVEVATEGAGCTWAPEAFWNDQTKEYMVFWSSKIPKDQAVDNNDETHRVYYATTRDFYTFSEPQVWIELKNAANKPISVIDATVIKVGSTYYRFIKNEATEAHKEGMPSTGKYIILQESDSLLGEWTEIDAIKNSNNYIIGVEGATCFKFNGEEDKWCLLLDDFGGSGYFPLTTTSLDGGEFTRLAASEYSFPSKMRHGTVLPLTQEEYDAFWPKSTIERWDDADEDKLTYEGSASQIEKNASAGGTYYMGTLTTLRNGWQEVSHQTKGDQGSKNAFYYYKKDGSTWGSNGDNAWSGEKDSYYEFIFTGTDIELYAYCNSSNKTGTVYIDGAKAGTINCASDTTGKKKVFEKTGMENKQHTVKVVVDTEGGFISAAGARYREDTSKNPSVSGTFTGTGFELIGPGSKGTYLVSIDGGTAETLTVSETVAEGKAAVKALNIGETDAAHTFKIEVQEGALCVDAVDIHKVYDPDAEPEDYELKDAKAKLKKAVDTYVLTAEEEAEKSPSSLAKYKEAYGYAKKALKDTSWGEQTAERILSYYNKLEKKWNGLEKKGTPVTYTSFTGTNGETWYDTDGTEIQAHGGQVLPVKQADGSTIYYWYGEDKTDGYRTVDGGVRVYSSTDLYNWKSEGIALRNLTDKYDFEEDYFKELYKDYTEEQREKVLLGINDSHSVIERPKVIYNEKNKNYVMWFHADGPTEDAPNSDYAAASAGVAVSNSPTGPFRYIDRYRLHYINGKYDQNKGMARDMNLFVDDDKKAYIFYSSEENYSMFVSLLNDDYTGLAVPDTKKAADDYDTTGVMDGFNRIACYAKGNGKDHREAPAPFKYQGKYYLMTSGCTGWGANQASYGMCEADSPLGTWKDLGDPCIEDKSVCEYGVNLTFGTQSTSIIPVDAANGKFIYMGDRWNNQKPGENNLIDPKYVWLPVCFKSTGEMSIYPKNDWTLDDLGQIEYVVELVTELPETVNKGSLDALPSSVKFTYKDEELTSAVKWDVKEGDLDSAGAMITVEGRLTDFMDGKTVVQSECFVISEDMQYFVDCGITADSGHTSHYYELVKTVATALRNSGAADAVWAEGSTWGVDSATVAGTVTYDEAHGGLRETGYYGDTKGKNITYYLTLDKGDYGLLTGHYEWWNTSRRDTDVKISYTKADGDEYSKQIGTVQFQGQKGQSGQCAGIFAVDQDNTKVTLTFSKAESSIEAGTVAYFAVTKVDPLEDAKVKLKRAVDTYVLTDKERAEKSPSSLEKYDEAYKYAKKALEDTSWGEQTAERLTSYYTKLEKKWKGLQEKGTPVTYTSFTGTNGDIWLDTDGTEIQAHGGQVLPVKQADGSTIYYWYGEDKTDGYRTVDGGVRVYSSTDLYNWKSEGIALRDLTDKYDFEEDYFNDLYGSYTQAQKDKVLLGINDSTSVIERPKVIYNEKTDKYVMWFHADGPTETSTANYAAASAGVAVSDSPTGPFRYIDRYRLHYINGGYDSSKGMARDMNLFVDDDKKAYIIYSSEENYSMFISLLNDDYTGLAVPDTEAAANKYDETGEMDGFLAIPCLYKAHREAPAMFKYQGRYYLMTSGATGWGANRAAYAVCDGDSPLDKDAWKDMGDPCVTDTDVCKYDSSITFGTQSTNIFAVDAENGKFIYMGDRWNNQSPAGNSLIDPKYVWLPVRFKSNGEMVLYPKNDWTLADLGQIEYVVELVTELPETIDRGSLNKLPGSVTFTYADQTYTSKVKWAVQKGDIDRAGSLVTAEGTLVDFKDGQTVITAQCLVVSEDLQYFVDCGITADSGKTSHFYTLAKQAAASLRNDTADAVYSTGSTWGIDMDTVEGTVGYSEANGRLCETGYYGYADSRKITYYLTLDKGAYSLLTGHYEWWSTGRRDTDVYITYTKEDGTQYNELMGTVNFQQHLQGQSGQCANDFEIDHNGTQVALTFSMGPSSAVAATVAYFAVAGKYEAPEEFTVTFDTAGGNEIAPVTARGGSRLSDLAIEDPVRAGYEFKGWYKDAACTEPWDYETDLITADITLYAGWNSEEPTPVERYTITFNTMGGLQIASVEADAGSKLSDLNIEETDRAGYVFTGWYWDEGCTTPWDDKSDTIQRDITLYAGWRLQWVDEAKVTFDTNGGTVISRVVCKKGSKLSELSIADPVKEGYVFTGWYKDLACTVAWDDEQDVITSDITLYAGWRTQTIDEATVTFDTDGGNTIQSVNCTTGSRLSDLKIADPVKSGYVFTGWYKDAACTMAWNDETDRITGNITLYAGWKKATQNGLWILPVGAYTYTGKAIKPEVTVYNGDTELIAGRDYTATYKNNTNVYSGTEDSKKPQIIIKGKNNYMDSVTMYFEILPKQITDQDIAANGIYVAANSKNKGPKTLIPVIQWGTKKLKYNKDEAKSDYTAVIPQSVDYTKDGAYTITVKGRGNYGGTRTVDLIVSTKTFLSKASVKGVKSAAYTGKPVTFDNLTVKLKKTLTKGKDYEVRYENNIQAGTGSVILTGKGDYVGEKRVTFKINGRNIGKAKVTGIVSADYTGSAVEQEHFTVQYGVDVLRQGTDFTVSYQNNVKAGTATIILNGINGFSGTKKQTFKILPYDITGSGYFHARVSESGAYRVKGAQPRILEISFNGKALEKDVDYKLISRKNKKIGETASYEIKGIGNFKGSVSGTFIVGNGDLSEEGTMIRAKDYARKNDKDTKYRTVPVVTDADGNKLKAGRDYVLRYLYDDENGAEITAQNAASLVPGRVIYVEAVGKGNFERDSRIGTTYRIIRKEQDIAKAKKVTVDVQSYTGEPIELTKRSIHIRMDGASQELKSGDFEIVPGTYQKNLKKGTAKVIVRGIGAYGGEKQISFKIKAGSIKDIK